MPRVAVITLERDRQPPFGQHGEHHQAPDRALLGIGSAEWKTRLTSAGYGGANGINGVRGFQAIGGQGLRVPMQPFNAALEPNLIEADVQDAHSGLATPSGTSSWAPSSTSSWATPSRSSR
jgi:hypothetical protein